MTHHSPQRKHWRSLTANWRTLTLKTVRSANEVVCFLSRCSKWVYTISRCYFHIESTFSGASVSFVLSHIARYVPSPEENSCIPITHFQCKTHFEDLLTWSVSLSCHEVGKLGYVCVLGIRGIQETCLRWSKSAWSSHVFRINGYFLSVNMKKKPCKWAKLPWNA